MSAVRNLIAKFTKNKVNDSMNSSAISLPVCVPPKTLASRTVDLLIGFPIEALDAKGQFNAVNIPLDNLESTEKNAASPLHQQEVSLLAPNPGLSLSTPVMPANNPNAGSPSPPPIYGDFSTSSQYSIASSGAANNKDTQEPQQGTAHNTLEDNRAKVRATINILFQDIQPQRILSINATLCDAESTPPLETLAPNNTDEAAQEPQMTVYDLDSSIRAVLSESHCEVQYLDAVEITGSPECFPFIQETLREVLVYTPQESIKFSWDKLGDTNAGYREVFLKDQLSPTTQVLIFHRHSDFSINLHCGTFKDDDSPNIIWYITGLGNETSPATVRLVYQLLAYGYCDIHPACTIIGPSGPTEQDKSTDKTFIDQRKLDVRYSFIRTGSITAQYLLLGPFDTPTLWDKTGKREALQLSTFIEILETACLFAFIPLLPCTILYCFMKSSIMYEVLVAVTATLAIPFLLRLLLIINPFRLRRLAGYQEPVKLALAGYLSFLIAIPALMLSVHDWQQSTSAIVFLCVHVVGIAAFVGPILSALLLSLSNTGKSAHYGDYLELGAVLEAESYFPMLFADSDEPRQSKALKRCLEHYRECEISNLLESHDTDENQDFWREMGILHRIPYALIPGSDSDPDELSLRCPRKDMTRAEAFKFVVVRKRKLCKRLEISIVDTDEEIKKRFSLIRDPDSKLVLI